MSSICATTMQVHGITCHLITPTGHEKDVTAENISKHLKLTAGLLNYPKCKGILGERVDTHSLRRGGANALTLSGYSETAIQKMGRWKGATFKEYIQKELANYTDGMSTAMKTKFNFMNNAGNVFRDITETVLMMEFSQPHSTYCTGQHCLRLGVIRIYMSMVASVGGGGGLGYFCI